MTAALVVLFFASALGSPGQTNYFGAPGCGPASVEFEVKASNGERDVPAPDGGEAIIVFLQDDAMFGARPRPTTRFGIDGTWVGATHANSYFYVSVHPGEHHLCANWQSHVATVGVPARLTAAAHFTADAGKTYYFRAWDLGIADRGGEAEIKLEPVDSDEAQILERTFDFSSSHTKK
jgi:hypothetical protein